MSRSDDQRVQDTAEQSIRLPGELAGRKPDPQWWNAVIAPLGLNDRLFPSTVPTRPLTAPKSG